MTEDLKVRAEVFSNSITNGVILAFSDSVHDDDLELAVKCSTALFHPLVVSSVRTGKNIAIKVVDGQLGIHIEKKMVRYNLYVSTVNKLEILSFGRN